MTRLRFVVLETFRHYQKGQIIKSEHLPAALADTLIRDGKIEVYERPRVYENEGGNDGTEGAHD